MAPLPELKAYITTLLRRTALPSPTTSSPQPLLKRTTPAPGSNGITTVDSIPNSAVFALFGLIGVGFVLTGIWFFFWAKNGGFVFKENDWDEYKSTVLRRKGPNGTTLSGATESTDLGGESVKGGRSIWGRKKKGRKGGASIADTRYKDFDEESTGFTETTATTESTARWKLRKDRKKTKKHTQLRGGDLASEMTEQTEMIDDEDIDHSVLDAMRAYRHEKPARVGGLNTKSDASAWDGSTIDTNSAATSDLLNHREKTPTSTPTKERKRKNDQYTGGIRKVVSTSAPSTKYFGRTTETKTVSEADTERSERIKVEAAKLQAKGRAAATAARRDFSFQTGDDVETVASSEDAARRQRHVEREARREARRAKLVPGGYIMEESEVGSSVGSSSDVGTKSYHHVIPGLSVAGGSSVVGGGGGYADEKRKKRGTGAGGYRRGRRDSLED